MIDQHKAKQYLDLAARVASRGFGHVEPNPMVGAVIVKDDSIIGIGHHTRFGDLHAEREAIANSKRQGHDPRDATLYCTLEPCSHHGKQPPCTQAVIEAGISQVIIARKDPAEVSKGGIDVLDQAGVKVIETNISPNATHLSDPFIHRMQTNRPWVIAKWAQTLDGKIATRIGESQWISNQQCRNRVHRLRAKVDAIMVGVGTALADDPLLTARDCRHTRRTAKRVVLDPHAKIDLNSKLIETSAQIPTIICTTKPERFKETSALAVQVPREEHGVDLHATLELLASQFQITTLLVEAGPRVLGSLIEHDLINEAIVHLAPGIIADEHAKAVAIGRNAPHLEQMRRFELIRTKQIQDDIELHYRRRSEP